MFELIIVFIVASLSALLCICYLWMKKAEGLLKIPPIIALVFALIFYFKLFQLPYFQLILKDLGIISADRDWRYVEQQQKANPEYEIGLFKKDITSSVIQVARYGESAIAPLHQEILNGEERKRYHYVEALAAIESKKVDPILVSLMGGQEPVGVKTAAAIGCQRRKIKPCLKNILNVFSSPNININFRRDLFNNLMLWASEDDDVKKEMLSLLKSNTWAFQNMAGNLSVNISLNPTNKNLFEIFQELIKAYAENSPGLKFEMHTDSYMFTALGLYKEKSVALLPDVLKMLDNSTKDYQYHYQETEAPSINRQGRQMLCGNDLDHVANAPTEMTIGKSISEGGERIIPILSARIKQSTDKLFASRAAAIALVYLGKPGQDEIIKLLSEEPTNQMKDSILFALINSPCIDSAVLESLKNTNFVYYVHKEELEKLLKRCETQKVKDLG